MTDIKIVYKNIGELNEAEYNPRKINAKQKEQMIKSIREFGFVDPIFESFMKSGMISSSSILTTSTV